jgi:hypothetical protein
MTTDPECRTTSRRARMPLGSSTWSVVTQNAGPLYASLEEITWAFVELAEFFFEEPLVLVFSAADFGMQSI